MTSQKGPRTKMVGAQFSGSQSAQVEGKDSTAESHSEADTSKASQPFQPSSALDTTAELQKDLQRTEPTKIPGNVGAPSGDSQPTYPNQVGVDNPAAKWHSEADTLKASRRALDGTNTPQSSTGTDTATKSSNPSKPCEDASTSSIKLQENTEVNQLPQKEEPRGTKGAKKPKASDIVQVEDDQATTPSMEEDTNQQMKGDIRGLKAKILSMETFASQKERGYTEKIERLETKISSLEKIVDQQQEKDNEKDVEDVQFFKTKISAMEAWIFRTEHGVNMKHKEIERLEGKQEKGMQRLEEIVGHLQTKVSSMEHAANMEHKHEIEYLKREHEKEIQRLEAIVERLQTKISSMEHAAHKQEIGRLEGKQEKEIERLEWKHEKEIERLGGKHDKEIQRLEAVVVSMSEQASKLEKEIGRLQQKVSAKEDAKQLGKRQAQDPPKSPDEKPIASSQASQASTVANKKIKRSAQLPGVKKEPLQIISPSVKQTSKPSPQAVVPKADSLVVTDVANLVKALNAEIGQTVNLLTESLSDLGLPSSDNKSEIVFDELRNYLGPWLYDKLEGKSEFDPLITQLALQTGLANACSSVVNDSPFWCNGSTFHTLYSRMAEREGQVAADEWRAKISNYLDFPRCEDANKTYLTEVLLKLVTAAVGGTLKSSEILLSQYNQQVEAIAKSAAKLHKTITEDVRSSELITFTISCDTEFDASQMEDSENNHGSTSHDKVICTLEMGLLCRKRVGSREPRGWLKDWGVTMKAKVVLAATLEG